MKPPNHTNEVAQQPRRILQPDTKSEIHTKRKPISPNSAIKFLFLLQICGSLLSHLDESHHNLSAGKTKATNEKEAFTNTSLSALPCSTREQKKLWGGKSENTTNHWDISAQVCSPVQVCVSTWAGMLHTQEVAVAPDRTL